MKHIAPLLAVALLFGCGKQTDIAGQWQGEPRRTNITPTASSTAVTTLSLRPDGTASVSTAFEICDSGATATGVEPLLLAAEASAHGAWRFVGGSEISITAPNIVVEELPGDEPYRSLIDSIFRRECASFADISRVAVKKPFLRFQTTDADSVVTDWTFRRHFP